MSTNDKFSSAYRIAFAGERERGRKQRDFVPKNAIHLFQNSSFSRMEEVELDTGENLRRPRSETYQFSNVTIIEPYFDSMEFRECFI